MDMRLPTVGALACSFIPTANAHITPINSGSNNAYETIKNIGIRSGSTLNLKLNSRNTQLKEIKEIFNFTNEYLAEIIGISRKTLDNWVNGGIKKAKDKQRVFELFMIAEDWNSNNLPTSYELISQPIVDGKSVVNLLQEDSLDKEKIIFAGRSLAHLSLQPEEGLF